VSAVPTQATSAAVTWIDRHINTIATISPTFTLTAQTGHTATAAIHMLDRIVGQLLRSRSGHNDPISVAAVAGISTAATIACGTTCTAIQVNPSIPSKPSPTRCASSKARSCSAAADETDIVMHDDRRSFVLDQHAIPIATAAASATGSTISSIPTVCAVTPGIYTLTPCAASTAVLTSAAQDLVVRPADCVVGQCRRGMANQNPDGIPTISASTTRTTGASRLAWPATTISSIPTIPAQSTIAAA
jgi:hypothetical protein